MGGELHLYGNPVGRFISVTIKPMYQVNDDGTVTVGEVKVASDVLADLNMQLTDWQDNASYHQGMLDVANTTISNLQSQIDTIQTAPAVLTAMKVQPAPEVAVKPL